MIFYLSCLAACAQGSFHMPASADLAGMNNVCVMKSTFWSSFQNQANLAFIKSFSAGINYEERFMLSELGTRTAALTLPAGRATLGAIYSNFGNTDYKRHLAGISCGMLLLPGIAAGVQADYFAEKTPGEYEDTEIITFEAGLVIVPSEKVFLGLHLFNPLPGSKIPSVLRAGAGIIPGDGVFAGFEAEMSTEGRPLLRTGVEYEAMKKFLMRGGFCTRNTSFSFGVGYRIDFVTIDFGIMSHEKLGISSSASVVFHTKP